MARACQPVAAPQQPAPKCSLTIAPPATATRARAIPPKASAAIGFSAAPAHWRGHTGEAGRGLLARCDDAVRICQASDAVQRARLAQRQRRLFGRRLYSFGSEDHQADRHDECVDLPKVTMPNRDGFIPDSRPELELYH